VTPSDSPTMCLMMERVLRALFPKMWATRRTTNECLKCEDGIIESLVSGSASKTEHSLCTCPRGRERLEEYE